MLKKHVPNFITSLNLVAGFVSIIFAFSGDTLTASWLILAAMIFDFFDGFSARMMKAYSDIGKELDSLADVVSFGVAPAVIIYNLLLHVSKEDSFIGSLTEGGYKIIIMLFAALMPVCAALRLAKFNIDPGQAKSFKGLPTPANAIGVISVVIAAHYSSRPGLDSLIGSPYALIIYSVVLSLLMVTHIPLLSLKVEHLRIRGNEGRFILIGLVVVSFIFLGWAAAPFIIPFYLIASLISRYF